VGEDGKRGPAEGSELVSVSGARPGDVLAGGIGGRFNCGAWPRSFGAKRLAGNLSLPGTSYGLAERKIRARRMTTKGTRRGEVGGGRGR
jgi:hypothetical protein